MPRYLLDTNIISDLVRSPHGRVRQMIERRGSRSICTSIVAAAELKYGALKSGSRKLAANIDAVLAGFDVLPFAAPADRRYAELRVALEGRGRPIGGNDMLIAAHALALDCILVTDNEREFARIDALQLENWL